MTTIYAPHQQRVIDEKAELDVKLAALGEFISKSPIFAALHDEERARLVCQEEVMKDYSSILGERISAFSA